jgi:hypothetical protein
LYILGRTPSISASEPTQKNDADFTPCFSAVTQIGSPPHHLDSVPPGPPMLKPALNAVSYIVLETIP